MFLATCLALFLAGACSVLSRSAMTWCAMLAVTMAVGVFIGMNDLYPYICVLATVVLLMMLKSYSFANRKWQEPVFMLQCGITLIYILFTVLGSEFLWMKTQFVDVANIAFLIQVALVGLGGAINSVRNYRYAMREKNSGDRTSFMILTWRMT